MCAQQSHRSVSGTPIRLTAVTELHADRLKAGNRSAGEMSGGATPPTKSGSSAIRGAKWNEDNMAERKIDLLHRNLQEVFGEGDAARRRAAIHEFYTDDAAVHVPDGTHVGHDAVDKFAGDLRATHPHFVYTPHGQAQALADVGILAWGSGPKGESPEYTGLDVIVVRDGKIAALYVFLNPQFG